MENLDKLIEELRCLIGTENSQDNARKAEILHLLKQHEDDKDVKDAIHGLIDTGLDELFAEVKTLKEEYSDEYNLLPLSYIAQHYFGKSRAWLYQRINGYKVRGRVYTLSESEKRIFNEAVQDVSRRIGSVRLV